MNLATTKRRRRAGPVRKPNPARHPGVNRPKNSRSKGKRALIAVVAAFALITVGRSVLPALGIDTPKVPSIGGGGAEPTTSDEVTKAPPAPTVDLNGVLVPGGDGPMVTLNPGLVRLGGQVTA